MIMKVIAINGWPATGKSTFVEFLRTKTTLPIFCKDDFKELLFDSFGQVTDEESKSLGKASFELIFHCLKLELRNHQNCIIESNIGPSWFSQRIKTLRLQFNFDLLVLNFVGDPEVLFSRYKERTSQSERHNSHRRIENVQEFEKTIFKDKLTCLEAEDVFIEVDTTDFSKYDKEIYWKEIQCFIEENSGPTLPST